MLDNVLFFSRGFTDHNNTAEVGLRPANEYAFLGKTHHLSKEAFTGFERAYKALDRHSVIFSLS